MSPTADHRNCFQLLVLLAVAGMTDIFYHHEAD